MALNFNSAPSYFWLNTWVMSNIIELATQSFCDRFIDYRIDPGHRLYDQMTQAARSIRANIAEGSSRHDTSLETEMRLTDVARASSHELMGDFMNYMMRHSLTAWTTDDIRFKTIIEFKLAKPIYSQNFIADAIAHIKSQKSLLDNYLENGTSEDSANCLIVLCMKINTMLTSMLTAQLRDFKENGGFTETLTQERLETRRAQSISEGSPKCPQCGKPMFRRTIKRGTRQGQPFWGCSAYPSCTGTIDI